MLLLPLPYPNTKGLYLIVITQPLKLSRLSLLANKYFESVGFDSYYLQSSIAPMLTHGQAHRVQPFAEREVEQRILEWCIGLTQQA